MSKEVVHRPLLVIGRVLSSRWPIATETLRRRLVLTLGRFLGPDSHSMAGPGHFDVCPVPPERRADDAYYTDSIYHIERGQVRTLKCGDTLALPPYAGSVSFRPCRIDPDVMSAQIEFAVRTLQRCAPWVRCYVGGTISMVDTGGTLTHPWGFAVYGSGGFPSAICIDGSLGIWAFRETLHHEIWHAVENDAIGQREIATFDHAVLAGVEYQGDGYLREKAERRARVYAHLACLREEAPGLSMRQWTDSETVSTAELTELVYTGALARKLGPDHLRDDSISPAEAVEQVLSARGQVEDGVENSLTEALRMWSQASGYDFDSFDHEVRMEIAVSTMEHSARLARDRVPLMPASPL